MNTRLVLFIFISWLIVIAFKIGLSFHNQRQFVANQCYADCLRQETRSGTYRNKQAADLGDIAENLELSTRVIPNGILCDQSKDKSVGIPSAEYEVIRRRLRTEVDDMWDFLNSKLQNLIQMSSDNWNQMQEVRTLLDDGKRAIINNLKKLTVLDGHDQWRLNEHQDLSDIIQGRLIDLQNPKNCSTAKKILCSLDRTFGWGNKMHHIALCLMVAYGSGRTLVFNWTAGWNFEGSQWTTYFKPLSETCVTADESSIGDWPGTSDTQVLRVPAYLDNAIPSYWPQSIPRDIADRLVRLHGRPFAWLYGQFYKYILRPQKYLEKTIATTIAKLEFQNPIVGIHVRRTDKLDDEAEFHNLTEYMKHVEGFYFELNIEHPNASRRVYLASDDPNVFKEAQNKSAD